MKENRKLAVWTLICTLCAGMLTGCGFFGKGFNNLGGQSAWKKTLKAYQAFLEDKVPDNEIYGDMIFPDKSGNLMLAVLYVDDARNGFDNAHFDLFGCEDGEVKRIEAFDPEEDAEENVKKQQHTAKRIYDRLVEETGFTGNTDQWGLFFFGLPTGFFIRV